MSNRSYTADTGYPSDYEATTTTYDTLGTNYESTGTTYDLTVGYDNRDEAYAPSGYGTSDNGTDATGLTYDADAYDTGYGTTAYDPSTGAYDQHLDFRAGDAQRHHRERLDPSGTYRHRDVDRRDDGSTHVHREYMNPNTGTASHRDYER
ncbi:uncharacterized protein N7484_007009 [Penicillium longicatenatum]|uniref:uncharacterized protein n=1 Tax=Penicillium longicatenatum TaxID=1561947 RepID=UPI0025477911|nr:uncharacterized protein N7484_007009 [Penicillium longicatenatum]KAJ5639147.1 hypothetical protein N7484_007009 [Penicillium longicatenatum]